MAHMSIPTAALLSVVLLVAPMSRALLGKAGAGLKIREATYEYIIYVYIHIYIWKLYIHIYIYT